MSTTIPDGQTVSSSNYYHKCAGCVERDQRISTLVATLDDLRERTAAREGELLGTIDALQATIAELREELAQWQHAAGSH